jgi:hypothetical protein
MQDVLQDDDLLLEDDDLLIVPDEEIMYEGLTLASGSLGQTVTHRRNP